MENVVERRVVIGLTGTKLLQMPGVETLEYVRTCLRLARRALDVDSGTEFVNDGLIKYGLSHAIATSPPS